MIGFTVFVVLVGIAGGVIMPGRDHRRVTAEFVRDATSAIPAQEALYVAGLGQSAAYPYISHENCIYVDSLPEIDAVLKDAGAEGILVFTLHQYLQTPGTEHWGFTLLRGEPVRKKHPLEESLILGRVVEQRTPTSLPAESAAP